MIKILSDDNKKIEDMEYALICNSRINGSPSIKIKFKELDIPCVYSFKSVDERDSIYKNLCVEFFENILNCQNNSINGVY